MYIYIRRSLKNKFIENQVNIPVESLGLSKYICETALKKHRMILILNVSHLDYLQSMDLILSKSIYTISFKENLFKKDTIKFGNPHEKRFYIY